LGAGEAAELDAGGDKLELSELGSMMLNSCKNEEEEQMLPNPEKAMLGANPTLDSSSATQLRAFFAMSRWLLLFLCSH
jgi:hypothetical protein